MNFYNHATHYSDIGFNFFMCVNNKTMSSQIIAMSPYKGFDSQSVPGYNQPYNQCGCGVPDACGNPHQPSVKVETVKIATATGTTKTVTRVAALGSMYNHINQVPFSTWDGSLALNDLYGPKKKPYRPPAVPYVCDRPMAGSSLCSSSFGKSPCDP